MSLGIRVYYSNDQKLNYFFTYKVINVTGESTWKNNTWQSLRYRTNFILYDVWWKQYYFDINFNQLMHRTKSYHII
jgi:hypothetical protein